VLKKKKMSNLHRTSSNLGEDWVGVQKKTFTRWANSYLVKRKAEVEDLSVDFQDGTKLGALLEVISNEKLNKLNPTPKIEIQKLENLNKCLQFLKGKEIHLVNIGSQDIFKGNEKLILGLLWTIILRFEVGDQEGKNGLLLWVQRSCKGYHQVDPPNVQNFSSDWNTGLPFCAIINRYRPDLLKYDGLSASNAAHNCELAFSIAEEKLGIRRFLDVQDVANHPRPDEKSIIAYVSQFFKLFAKASKNDALLKSIKNAVEVTKRHDAWMAKYEETATGVADWINSSVHNISQPSSASTTDQVKAELEEFTSHMRTAKPTMQATKAELEATATQLVNSKRNNKRPSFEPHVAINAIGQSWAQLEQAEMQRENDLLDKYRRFQQVDNEVAKFTGRAASMQAYLNDTQAKVSKGVPAGLSLTQLESEVETQDGVDSRLAQYAEVLGELETYSAKVQELGRGEHEECAPVASKAAQLSTVLQKVTHDCAGYRAALNAAIESEREAVKLERSFKHGAEELAFDLDQLETLVNQPIVVSSVEDVTTLSQGLVSLRQEEGKAKAALQALAPIAQKLASRRPQHQEFVSHAQARLADIEKTLHNREEDLDRRHADETSKDGLRKQFAQAANGLAPKLEKVSADLASMKGELETQLQHARALSESLAGPLKTEVENVDALAVQCDSAGIVHNPLTTHTIFSLKAQYNQLLKAASDEEQSLNAQILAKKALEVTPEQLKEIQEVFKFFDSNNTGTIGLSELKEACTGAGIDLQEEEIERRMYERKADMMFTMDDFTAFMLAELKNDDTIDHIMNAFRQLADGGEALSPEQLNSAFQSEPDLLGYISQHMSNGDFKAFIQQLFSR